MVRRHLYPLHLSMCLIGDGVNFPHITSWPHGKTTLNPLHSTVGTFDINLDVLGTAQNSVESMCQDIHKFRTIAAYCCRKESDYGENAETEKEQWCPTVS